VLTRVPLSIETKNVWGCEEGGVVPMKATEVPRVVVVSEKPDVIKELSPLKVKVTVPFAATAEDNVPLNH